MAGRWFAYQQHNGEPLQCPVRALARRVIHMRTHNAVAWDYLSTYFVDGVCQDVTAEDISKHLKIMAGLLHYPTPHMEGHSHCTGGHTLPAGGRGGANALTLLVFLDTDIQKMGRWQGATFKEYIRVELVNYSDKMSTALKTEFSFMNVARNAFNNITDTVLPMDYNTEFVMAAAAQAAAEKPSSAIVRRLSNDADVNIGQKKFQLKGHSGISHLFPSHSEETGPSTAHLLYRAALPLAET